MLWRGCRTSEGEWRMYSVGLNTPVASASSTAVEVHALGQHRPQNPPELATRMNSESCRMTVLCCFAALSAWEVVHVFFSPGVFLPTKVTHCSCSAHRLGRCWLPGKLNWNRALPTLRQLSRRLCLLWVHVSVSVFVQKGEVTSEQHTPNDKAALRLVAIG